MSPSSSQEANDIAPPSTRAARIGGVSAEEDGGHQTDLMDLVRRRSEVARADLRLSSSASSNTTSSMGDHKKEAGGSKGEQKERRGNNDAEMKKKVEKGGGGTPCRVSPESESVTANNNPSKNGDVVVGTTVMLTGTERNLSDSTSIGTPGGSKTEKERGNAQEKKKVEEGGGCRVSPASESVTAEMPERDVVVDTTTVTTTTRTESSIPGAFHQPGIGLPPPPAPRLHHDSATATATSSTSSNSSDAAAVDDPEEPCLVQAREVSEVPEVGDLEAAQPMESPSRQRKVEGGNDDSSRLSRIVCLGILLFLVLMGGVVVPLLVLSDHDKSPSNDHHTTGGPPRTAAPAPSQRTQKYDPMMTGYLMGILSSGSTPTLSMSFNEFLQLGNLNGSSSSYTQYYQNQTFDWMLQDPLLTTYTADRVLQRLALVALFFATQGDHWTDNDNWLSYQINECDWFAANNFRQLGPSESSDYPCNVDTNLYERLWLPSNNLNGTLPDEIYYLISSLQSINFWGNVDLVGTISPNIQLLSNNLRKVSFYGCSVWGTLPTEIGRLSQLQILYISAAAVKSDWRLHGTIPKEIQHLTSLEHFTTKGNRFEGKLPTQIGLLKNLTVLGIQENQFSGELPTQLGLLSKLRFLYMADNPKLNSTIPSQFGLLESLGSLHAQTSQLKGTIPTQLGSLTQIKELVLADNHLTGTVPSQLGELSSMRMFFLAQNQGLIGTLPSEVKQLEKIELIDFSDTGITGSLPDSFQDLPTFEDFLACAGGRFPC